MTSCFQITEPVGRIKDDAYVSSSSPGSSTSGKAAVYECRLVIKYECPSLQLLNHSCCTDLRACTRIKNMCKIQHYFLPSTV